MNFKVFLLTFVLPIFLSKYPPIFIDISDISVKFKYRNICNYRYFVSCSQYQLNEPLLRGEVERTKEILKKQEE